MARSSGLSSTRRRGSIPFVSTMNRAAVRGQPETRVQRREAAPPEPPPSDAFQRGAQSCYERVFPRTKNLQLTTFRPVSSTAPTPDRRLIFSIGLPGHPTPASTDLVLVFLRQSSH